MKYFLSTIVALIALTNAVSNETSKFVGKWDLSKLIIFFSISWICNFNYLIINS
jgi:hypothetical protein